MENVNDRLAIGRDEARVNEPASASVRNCFHHNEEICKYIKSTITTMLSLDIKASRMAAPGSGLFYTGEEPLREGQEIFRSQPIVACIETNKKNICHYCFADSASDFDSSGKLWERSLQTPPALGTCSGCKVARFCSKACQQKAWKKFHREECKILKEYPELSSKHLVTLRLLSWQKRKLISTEQGEAIYLFDSHFKDIMDDKDKERASCILDGGEFIHEIAKTQVTLGGIWRLWAQVLTNCIDIRHGYPNVSLGTAIDLAAAVINHSCSPNAFYFFEGNELRLRSVTRIKPGEEITVAYIDPTIAVAKRIEILKEHHFFECHCAGCHTQLTEERNRVGGDQAKIKALHEIQDKMAELMHDAMVAFNKPGSGSHLEDPDRVQYELLLLARSAFPGGQWFPDHLDPMPSARLCLADLYRRRGKLVTALRLALKGKVCSRHRSGPVFINEMLDALSILVAVGDLPVNSPEFSNAAFPRKQEVQTVVYGYTMELCKVAGQVYGGDANMLRIIAEAVARLVNMSEDPKPGSKGFKEKFELAQAKLLGWAGIDQALAIVLSR